MQHKYGIYQSTSKSCIFYKQDEDGKQSTFNLFANPEEDEKKNIFAFIDNEQTEEKNWAITKDTNVEDIVEAFGSWASDAPVLFELEAQKSMSNCLQSVLKEG